MYYTAEVCPDLKLREVRKDTSRLQGLIPPINAGLRCSTSYRRRQPRKSELIRDCGSHKVISSGHGTPFAPFVKNGKLKSLFYSRHIHGYVRWRGMLPNYSICNPDREISSMTLILLFSYKSIERPLWLCLVVQVVLPLFGRNS